MKQRFSLLAILFLAASAAGLAQSQAPSLAEVARQTREEKKPIKVFTDADLPSRSSSTSSMQPAVHGGASVAGGKTADSETATAPASTGKADAKQSDSSPAKGKDSVAGMKKELDHYTEQRDAWKKSVQRYQDLLQNETSEFRRQTYQEALDVDQHNLELYQQKIDDLQSQMAKAQQVSGSSGQGSEDQAGSGGHR